MSRHADEEISFGITLCVRPGFYGRLCPLVIDLPRSEEPKDIVVLITMGWSARRRRCGSSPRRPITRPRRTCAWGRSGTRRSRSACRSGTGRPCPASCAPSSAPPSPRPPPSGSSASRSRSSELAAGGETTRRRGERNELNCAAWSSSSRKSLLPRPRRLRNLQRLCCREVTRLFGYMIASCLCPTRTQSRPVGLQSPITMRTHMSVARALTGHHAPNEFGMATQTQRINPMHI